MKLKNSFLVSKLQIDVWQTLACGQVFSYKQTDFGFVVFSADKFCEIVEQEKDYKVFTDDEKYFQNYFDLNTDYEKIKTKLLNFEFMENPIKFGKGIRILRQNLLETIISFAISANNNIKRITASLFYIRRNFGDVIDEEKEYYAFPTLTQLQNMTEDDFKKAGTGYRAGQLVKLVGQLGGEFCDFEKWQSLPTEQVKEKLLQLSGVGPKVADCIMLFGYSKPDVFPVDTWIEKVYNTFFEKCTDRKRIRRNLVEKFNELSGYAQQYLFFYQREKNI